MTELEALKLVLDAAEWADEEMAEPGKVDLREALTSVKALIGRVEQAESTPCGPLKMVEGALHRLGVAVVTTIQADAVRELLIEQGCDGLAKELTDEAIASQVDFVLSKRELPMGFDDWRFEVEWAAAKDLAEAAGLTWSESLP